MDDVRLVLQLVTPILLFFGLWILNSVSGRITKIENQIGQFVRDCDERHKDMWRVIREQEGKVSRIQGRMNGWPTGE